MTRLSRSPARLFQGPARFSRWRWDFPGGENEVIWLEFEAGFVPPRELEEEPKTCEEVGEPPGAGVAMNGTVFRMLLRADLSAVPWDASYPNARHPKGRVGERCDPYGPFDPGSPRQRSNSSRCLGRAPKVSPMQRTDSRPSSATPRHSASCFSKCRIARRVGGFVLR
jgi:hypothetical protein